MALRGRFQKGIFVAWQVNGIACVNQTRPHYVNQIGKTQSKALAERHGRGTAGERHGNGMVCVNQPLIVVIHITMWAGIATSYGLDGLGIESRWGVRYSTHIQTGPGAHPASYTMCTGSFPWVKRLGHGVDHPTLVPRLRKG
jgi:hypothetical protein